MHVNKEMIQNVKTKERVRTSKYKSNHKVKIDYSKTNTQQYGAGELCTCGPFIFGEEYVGFSGFGSVAS